LLIMDVFVTDWFASSIQVLFIFLLF
jgi:hypothetical protein